MKIENLDFAVRLKSKRDKLKKMSSILGNSCSVIKVSSSMTSDVQSESVDDPTISAMLKKYIDERLVEIDKKVEEL